MGKMPRVLAGGVVYHVLNRANDRARIFAHPGDYFAFEQVLFEAKKRYDIEIFAYCIMPNHWHLVVRPARDGDIALFMHWLTLTHSQRWRTQHATVGNGHLYQGRYHSFPVQEDHYFIRLCRYVERNPLRAKLVSRAERWRWSSTWHRRAHASTMRMILDRWPVPAPRTYLDWVNTPQSQAELDAIRQSARRGSPYGDVAWVRKTARAFGLESTLRPRGRPRG